MKILVSACLMGRNCKYNGKNNYSEAVKEFVKGHEVIEVCPEVLGGLPTPRIPSEIVNGKVINAENKSVDLEFRRGAKKALEIAKEHHVDVAILKSKSPSCGAKEIYDGTFSGRTIKGMGVFARLLKENNIKMIDVEDLQKGEGSLY